MKTCKVKKVRGSPETYKSRWGTAQKLKRGLWTVAKRGSEGFLVKSKKKAIRSLCGGK